jgi:uncharacterized membrane protein
VLLCLASTLLVGLAVKDPCASGVWSDGRQYRRLCYSDIVPLLGTEQLATHNRLPFLDPCEDTSGNCDEYPVVTMYVMRLAAWLSPTTAVPGGPAARSYAGFFYANVVLLAVAAFAIALALYLLVGVRALYFALAPTLLIYGFMNWDLVAVMFATLGTLAYLNRRDIAAGGLLGAGAATKLYPAILVVPFVLGRFHEHRRVGGIHLTWAAGGTWFALNIPFALAAGSGWWEFFRFNSARPPDWDSLWFIACRRIPGFDLCERIGVVNLVSLALLVLLSIAVWRMKAARQPDFPRWTFGFPLLILFLLTNKVYSPQYGLWLLPWFALTLPDLRRVAAFEAADVAVFVTRFAFFGQQEQDVGGWVDAFTIGWFQIAVLIRAAILIWCIAGWVTRTSEPLTRRDERSVPNEAAAGTVGTLEASA